MAIPFLKYSQVLELKKGLQGTNAEVVALNSEEYPECISRWSESCKRNAGAIVRVTTADEVSKVVQFATKHHFPVVVQAGGHNTSGASSTHGGIVISLSRMDRVSVNHASMTVTVQGGAKWGDVDVAAAEQGLAVVGCTANHTGVGGSALGGGYGWLTGQYGLAIDNLLSVTLVLADGRVLVASATENPDLFWAVRGAGQNFGVATEFIFQAHPQENRVFGGPLLFGADKLPKIVEFANQFEHWTDGRQAFFVTFVAINADTSIIPATEHGSTAVVVEVLTFHNGTREEAERIFQPLLSLSPILNRTGMMPYHQINSMVNKALMIGPRKQMNGTNFTLPLDVDFMQQIYNEFNHVLDTYPVSRDSILSFQLIPYTQVVKVANEVTTFANRGRYYNVQSIFSWSDQGLDSRVRSLQRELLQKIEHQAGVAKRYHQKRESQGGVGVYANFVGNETNAKELFGDNWFRLRELKMRYDPNNVFRKWHDILWDSRCQEVQGLVTTI